MMKVIVAATMLASLMAANANATTVWQGEAVIDTATPQCETIPSAAIKADSVLKTVLRPKNLTDNGPDTQISFLANGIAMFAMKVDKGAMPNGTALAYGSTSSAVLKTAVGTIYKQFVQTPATVLVGTETVTLSGLIRGFLFVTGCDVTFRAAYSKRD